MNDITTGTRYDWARTGIYALFTMGLILLNTHIYHQMVTEQRIADGTMNVLLTQLHRAELSQSQDVGTNPFRKRFLNLFDNTREILKNPIAATSPHSGTSAELNTRERTVDDATQMQRQCVIKDAAVIANV